MKLFKNLFYKQTQTIPKNETLKKVYLVTNFDSCTLGKALVNHLSKNDKVIGVSSLQTEHD